MQQGWQGKATMVAFPRPPTEVAKTAADELRHARVAHEDAKERAEQCSARFKAAAISAVEAGMSHNVVAELAGVSRARLHKIILQDALRRG